MVQDDRFAATASVTVCLLTTKPVEAPPTRIVVEPTVVTGIEQPSSIMVDTITTMPRVKVRDRLGHITDADHVRFDRALIVFLGLAE